MNGGHHEKHAAMSDAKHKGAANAAPLEYRRRDFPWPLTLPRDRLLVPLEKAKGAANAAPLEYRRRDSNPHNLTVTRP
jgi:hypothetical protein